MRQLDASTSSEACTNSLTFSDSSVASHVRVVMVTSGGGSFAVVTDADQPFSRIHELAYSSSKAALNMLTVRTPRRSHRSSSTSPLPEKSQIATLPPPT